MSRKEPPAENPDRVMIGDFGQSLFPEGHRRGIEYAIGFLAERCHQTGRLRAGRTALYWAVVATVAKHFRPPETV